MSDSSSPPPPEPEPKLIENARYATWEVEGGNLVIRLWREDDTPFAAAVFTLQQSLFVAGSMQALALQAKEPAGGVQ